MQVYFTVDMNITTAKNHYWALLQQYHPDHAGTEGEEITKEINLQYDLFCAGLIRTAFDTAGEEKTKEAHAEIFADILKKIMRLNCRIEIIGFWLYCFDSYAIKDELANMGFFFSGKHKAWIFNGGKKLRIRTHNTTDDNRAKYGSTILREKQEAEKLQA
jgi:DnaJ-class molecular chaperone